MADKKRIEVAACFPYEGKYVSVKSSDIPMEGIDIGNLNQDTFQFYKLGEGYYAIASCVCRTPGRDETRGYCTNLALYFDSEQCSELLTEPKRLEILRRILWDMDKEEIEKFVEEPWDTWPEEILSLAPAAQFSISKIAKECLKVVMESLVGTPCYAVGEGELSDVIGLMRILPLTLRKECSFSVPLTTGTTAQLVNLMRHGQVEEFRNSLAIREVKIDRAKGALVSEEAIILADMLISMSKKTIGILDSVSDGKDKLIQYLRLYQQFRTVLEKYDEKEILRMLKRTPELEKLLTPDEMEQVIVLKQRKRAMKDNPQKKRVSGAVKNKTTTDKPLKRNNRRQKHKINISKMVVALAMIILIFVMMIYGSGVSAGSNWVYISIRFRLTQMIQNIVCILIGLCGGFLIFGKRRK